MKKILLLFFILVLSFPVFSQTPAEDGAFNTRLRHVYVELHGGILDVSVDLEIPSGFQGLQTTPPLPGLLTVILELPEKEAGKGPSNRVILLDQKLEGPFRDNTVAQLIGIVSGHTLFEAIQNPSVTPTDLLEGTLQIQVSAGAASAHVIKILSFGRAVVGDGIYQNQKWDILPPASHPPCEKLITDVPADKIPRVAQ
jgi:hypothetical protein